MYSNDKPAFARYIGIDYSGAATPRSSLKGLRVYQAERATPPAEVLPPPSPRKYWTRRGIAEWLAQRLAEDAPTLVGIDHGFSFPLRRYRGQAIPGGDTGGDTGDRPRFPLEFPATVAEQKNRGRTTNDSST